jgi:hypothetical protein
MSKSGKSTGNVLLEMQKQMDAIMKENEELKKQVRPYIPSEVECEINDHCGVSVIGIGKYPVKLFPEQMLRLMDKKDMILKFIDDNTDDLAWKNNK